MGEESTYIFAAVMGASVIIAIALVVLWRFNVGSHEGIRARLSEEILYMANLTLDYFKDGMTPEAAREVCKMLLPATSAVAVSITNRTHILSYQGYYGDQPDPTGFPIETSATQATISDGKVRVLPTKEDKGFPESIKKIEAVIVVPLIVGSSKANATIEGALKLYYAKIKQATGTEISIARGIGRILSTQMTAVEMENQREIATNMELKMLQSQINPHFLFNTINTIASLVRTDPDKARMLLRDFAAFYRSTLKNPSEAIELAREIEQTLRYFSLVVARFGEDRVTMEVSVDAMVADLKVPPFLIQPIVENAVTHGMTSQEQLIIRLRAKAQGDDVVVIISDNGAGMDNESYKRALSDEPREGLGLGLQNVKDRLRGTFGKDATLTIESALGRGTRVTMLFRGALAQMQG